MKRKLRKIRHFFNRYINGTKGIISIFLSLVMLPFWSCALVTVESARYQNAIELVEEMLDCIGLSSVADFDTYLEDRFGLLALSQETDPTDNVNKYITSNIPALSNSVKGASTTSKGVYPLGEEGVIKEQLLEYGEIMALTEAMYNGFDIEEKLNDLYKKLGLEDLNKMADATSAVADVASSVADLLNIAKEGNKEYSNYKKQLAEYKDAVYSFQSKAGILIDALNEADNNLQEDASPDDIYNDQAVKEAISKCEIARDNLKNETKEMSLAVGKMKSTLDKMFSKINKIAENTYNAKKSIDKVKGTTLKEDCTTTTIEWLIQVSDEITNVLEKCVSTTYSADMQEQMRLLDNQCIQVGKVKCSKSTENDTYHYYIDINSTRERINADFYVITIDCVKAGFESEMQGALDKLDNKKPNISNEESNRMGKLLDIAGELLNVTAFYNGELDANVRQSAFYRYNANDVSFASTKIMNSLTDIVQSGEEFLKSIKTGNIFNLAVAVGKYMRGIYNFLQGIIGWVAETVVSTVQFIASGSEMYNMLILSAYSVYNMPCRTTYDSGSSLSGYSYNKIFTTMGGKSGNKITGSFDDLKTLMSASGSGTDAGFRGAEVEYLLIGDENELLNQSTAFFNLYMLRMIFDLQPIFSNSQVKAMASAANIGGWIVYLAIIIAEPMIDALLLVNGQSTYLLKDQIYLTPGGMILLVETLPKLTGLSSVMQDKIEDAIVADNGKANASGKWEMNYQEHMMILLLLTVSQTKLLTRMSNLVQMEAAEYYKTSHTFDLDKSFTFLEINFTGVLNSMFDMEALTKNGPFTIKCKRMIGY